MGDGKIQSSHKKKTTNGYQKRIYGLISKVTLYLFSIQRVVFFFVVPVHDFFFFL